MRRVICILLAVSLMAALALPAFAREESEPRYGTLRVEYTDALGMVEALEVMSCDGYIYVQAETICQRLGYACQASEMWIDIKEPIILGGNKGFAVRARFQLNSDRVSYCPFTGMECSYKAPCRTISNDRGVWIPLRYTLSLLGGGSNMMGDVLRIQMPTDNVMTVVEMISYSYDTFAFDWTAC